MNVPVPRSLSLLLHFGIAIGIGSFIESIALADVALPNVFSDHMVLQRDQPNKLWGKAEPSESISATIAGQTVTTKADSNGFWSVMLPKLEVGGPLTLEVKGKNELKINDILVGEVWICSGQSNMQWTVSSANDSDLERLTSNYPQIRMVNFPQIGSQAPIWSHDDRRWQVSSPETVGGFSAVGYFFARQLHQTLNVPIGMVNNAWGGSACEAWIDLDSLSKAGKYQSMLDSWANKNKEYADQSKVKDFDENQKKRFEALRGSVLGNQNPGNIYNGVLSSHIGYGIKGAIWYQGESNASRAYQYRELFPLMISTWRKAWNQGDFPFYWVQLADFKAEKDEPGESDWAELREAQTLTMNALPKTGQAVIVDIGEGKDIHPKNKVDVGRRLARWALANEYGVKIPYQSPQYKSMVIDEKKIVLTFEHFGNGWRPFDTAEPKGFAVAGEDRKFVWATAKIEKDHSVTVSSPEVSSPVAVRYAWSDNPRCNMFGMTGLPLTPFRTDDWLGVTAEAK